MQLGGSCGARTGCCCPYGKWPLSANPQRQCVSGCQPFPASQITILGCSYNAHGRGWQEPGSLCHSRGAAPCKRAVHERQLQRQSWQLPSVPVPFLFPQLLPAAITFLHPACLHQDPPCPHGRHPITRSDFPMAFSLCSTSLLIIERVKSAHGCWATSPPWRPAPGALGTEHGS